MARDFDEGTSQYLSNANAVVGAAPLTVCAWFNVSSTDVDRRIFSIDDDGNPGEQFSLRLHSTATLRCQAWDGAADCQAQATLGYSANTWQHGLGTITRSGGDYTCNIWLDGANFGTYTNTLDVLAVTDTHIGATRPSVAGQYMDGYLAEVAVWNVELTAADAAILATGLSPLTVRPQSLVAYWPLIGRTSPEIDIVGGYDMTLNAAPTIAAHPPVMYPASPMMVHAPSAFIPVTGPFPTFFRV